MLRCVSHLASALTIIWILMPLLMLMLMLGVNGASGGIENQCILFKHEHERQRESQCWRSVWMGLSVHELLQDVSKKLVDEHLGKTRATCSRIQPHTRSRQHVWSMGTFVANKFTGTNVSLILKSKYTWHVRLFINNRKTSGNGYFFLMMHHHATPRTLHAKEFALSVWLFHEPMCFVVVLCFDHFTDIVITGLSLRQGQHQSTV